MKKFCVFRYFCVLLGFYLTACEKPVIDGADGNVILNFQTTGTPTRATITIGDYFTKINVQMFDAEGNKVFDKVRTQYSSESSFGQMSLQLAEGDYTIVAVGHSSVKSATIKSAEMVQFTASDGEKLTDTFCYCGEISVGEKPGQHNLMMQRVTAMMRFSFTDEEIPASLSKVKFDYNGGSANFNPSSGEGTTRSTQSELRTVNVNDNYQIYTFPYMSATGALRVTITALDSDGNTIRQRVVESVPVTRNRITTFTGHLFDDSPGDITQSGFGFTVDPEWSGVDYYTF